MKAIIIGATSGIGRELAKQMSAQGYTVGITGRRTQLLDSLEHELSTPCFKAEMDLIDIDGSVTALEALLCQMGDVDIVVINSGTGSMNPEFPLADELETVAVNVTGFTAMANIAYRYFVGQKGGQLVGISSISALRGGPAATYNGSKAYVSNYLEGLACRKLTAENNIIITDVRPGFVDTDMAKGDRLFWKAPVEKAVTQIVNAIKQQRKVVYITKRWRLIAMLLSILPFSIYRKLYS